ncbi:hypothetical protein ACLB2K_027112 [Fragaria x ananassa]
MCLRPRGSNNKNFHYEIMDATKEDAQAIFDSLKQLIIFQRRGLQLDSFFRYLFRDLNPPIFPKVNHDMNAPLSHYFLFTGHNSYLTENQLSSHCSVRPLIQALQRGVRVIELDLWPNSKKNGIVVRHAGTLTRPVELNKCLRAIKDNGFTASEYPVVITFEDHLTSELQAIVSEDGEEGDPDEDEENPTLQYKHLTAIDAGNPKGGVGIAGVPRDTVMEETKGIENEWIPVWNEEFSFPLSVPKLAVLRIEVKEQHSSGNHDFGGQTCLPISELRTGFRAVPLHDKKGVRYKSVKLLMRFDFESPE